MKTQLLSFIKNRNNLLGQKITVLTFNKPIEFNYNRDEEVDGDKKQTFNVFKIQD